MTDKDMKRSIRRKKMNKKMREFARKMRVRLVVIFGLICLALLALVGVMLFIQYEHGEQYSKIVLANRAYSSNTLPFQRGSITDRNGTILASSVDVYNIIIDCKVVNDKEKYIEPTVTALKQCFPELAEIDLTAGIKEKKKSSYWRVAKHVSADEMEAFNEILKDKENYPNVKGVWFEKEYEREYPLNEIASTIVGFTTTGNEGINGLESYYNSLLNGTDGREYGYVNADNSYEKTVIQPTDGQSIQTTIDVNIQSVVEKKILEFNQKFANNAREGAGSENTAVVVANPKNGEILAMAEYPSYNLSSPRDLTAYYSQEQIDNMSDEDKINVLNDLWENYCITETYEPGSTAKLFTVAAALESGAVSPDEHFYCDGFETIGKRDIHCVSRAGHKDETIEQAIMNSCNDVMMQLVKRTGPDVFMKYQQIFNVGLKTNIDLPGEARTDSLIYTPETMNETALATNSFGQNFNVTMIQMVAAYGSILNGGTYYQPHIVKKITDATGNTIENIEPTIVRETISKETSELLRQYLLATVADGTAQSAQVEGFLIGGKTGTAETLPRKNGQYLISFIGAAPMDDPQVIVYALINKPNVEEQAHSTYAQELARDIFAEIFPYMNIYPNSDITADVDPNAQSPEEATDDTPEALPEGEPQSDPSDTQAVNSQEAMQDQGNE